MANQAQKMFPKLVKTISQKMIFRSAAGSRRGRGKAGGRPPDPPPRKIVTAISERANGLPVVRGGAGAGSGKSSVKKACTQEAGIWGADVRSSEKYVFLT